MSPSAGSISNRSRSQVPVKASTSTELKQIQQSTVTKQQLTTTITTIAEIESTKEQLEITTSFIGPVSKQQQQLQIPEVAVTEASSSPSPRPSSSEGKEESLSVTLTTTEDRGRGGEEEEESVSERRKVQESKGARSKIIVPKEESAKRKGSRQKEHYPSGGSSSKPLTPSPSRATLQEEEGAEEKSIARGMRLVIESVIETADPESATAIKAVQSSTGHQLGSQKKHGGIHLDLRSQVPKFEDVEEKRSDKIIR